MAKVNLPKTVYVFRENDGGTDYLVAFETLEEVAEYLGYNSTDNVGVYSLTETGRVTTPTLTLSNIKKAK